MYRLFLGSIAALSATPLPPTLYHQAPRGARRGAWLAGRALLAHAVTPLPPLRYGALGKPAFPPDIALWFNLSHSGDAIALLLSDEGEVGCDIEVVRPRSGWPAIAAGVFSPGEQQELAAEPARRQLAAFWRIWTRKEAILKQRGGGVWQAADVDSTHQSGLFVSQRQIEQLSLAVCTPTPFTPVISRV